MKSLSNNKGFSLIELMIVVAIIGILAAVAIPNFQSFIRRSKSANAKANLSVVYTGQRAFFDEWSFYDGRFGHIGYRPEGDMTYNVRTAAVADPGSMYTNRKGNAVSAQANADDTDSVTYCAAVGACENDPVTTTATCTPAGTGAGNGATFEACAAADLGGDAEDIWTINQSKAMIQTSVGE